MNLMEKSINQNNELQGHAKRGKSIKPDKIKCLTVSINRTNGKQLSYVFLWIISIFQLNIVAL